MATIIDSLLIELGFETSKFNKEQKKVVGGLGDIEKKSKKSSKELQDNTKKSTDSFSKFRNEILATVTAFASVSGIKSFSERITTSDAAMGRLANNLGMATSDLSAWTMMANKAGGTAEGMAGSIKGLVDRVQQFQLTGEGGDSFKFFTAKGIALVDQVTGKMRPMRDIMLESADALSKMTPTQAQAWGKGMGFDESTVNVLMKGRGAVEGLLKDQEKLAIVNQRDAKQAAERQAAWNKLSDQLENTGREILNDLQPTIKELAEDFAAWLRKIDPKDIEKFTRAFIDGGKQAINMVGGLTNAVEILMGLWVGSKFLSMMSGIKAMTGGLGGATSLLGKLGLVGAAGAAGVAIGEEINKHLSDETKDAIGGTVAGMVARAKGFGEKAKTALGGAASGATELVKGVGDKVKGAAVSVMKFFEDKGWTPEQAAGITANLQQESGFDPKAKGDGGKAAGVAQWHPDRQENFKKFSGKDIKDSSLEEQLAFVDYELKQGTEKWAGKLLMKAKTAMEAAGVVSSKYERPAAKEKEMLERGVSAEKIQQARNSVTNNQSNQSSNSTNIGQMVINTQASDAKGIMRDAASALKNQTFANQSIQGVT